MYEDYQKWCEAKDLNPLPRGALDLVFKDYKAGGRLKTPLRCNPNYRVQAFRSPKKKGLMIMAREEMCVKNIEERPHMPIGEMHNSGLSAVEQRQSILEEANE